MPMPSSAPGRARTVGRNQSESGSSLSFSLMILPLHSFHALLLVVVVVFKLSQFVDNCNDCFCLFIDTTITGYIMLNKREREREKSIKPCYMLFWPAYKSSWHHCACFVCFLVADDDDVDVVAVVVLACHFTFYAVAAAAAAYCLLRVYLRYVSTACVCVCAYRVVCFITKISARACVCIHTKNITDILLYIQERTCTMYVCVHWHASVVYN